MRRGCKENLASEGVILNTREANRKCNGYVESCFLPRIVCAQRRGCRGEMFDEVRREFSYIGGMLFHCFSRVSLTPALNYFLLFNI